jgi:alpha-amylase
VYASFTWNNTNDSPPSDANGFVTNTNCSSGWYCTDRITGVANMVGWHNLALANGDPVANWYTDGTNLIAFSRGPHRRARSPRACRTARTATSSTARW